MTRPSTLNTSRLHLRQWRDEDLPIFAAMNADPKVMEFFPKPLDRAESDAVVARIRDHFARRGFGLWAVEVPGVAGFIGFVGLAVPTFQRTSRPASRSAGGWPPSTGAAATPQRRLGPCSLRIPPLALEEIVSFTVPANLRSRRVMERIGMTRSPADDYDHPALPEGHPLRRHVLYRARRSLELPADR